MYLTRIPSLPNSERNKCVNYTYFLYPIFRWKETVTCPGVHSIRLLLVLIIVTKKHSLNHPWDNFTNRHKLVLIQSLLLWPHWRQTPSQPQPIAAWLHHGCFTTFQEGSRMPTVLGHSQKSQDIAMCSLILSRVSRQTGKLRKKTAPDNNQMSGLPNFISDSRHRHLHQFAFFVLPQPIGGCPCS